MATTRASPDAFPMTRSLGPAGQGVHLVREFDGRVLSGGTLDRLC